MTVLQIDLACGDYDIVRPLRDGTVKAEGMEINFVTINKPPEVHWRMGSIRNSMPPRCHSAVSLPAKRAMTFPSLAFPLSSIGNFDTHAPMSMSKLESVGRRI